MIWLLRHAEAVDGSPDAHRELTKKGRRQADAAGRALAALGVEFDLCLTSPRVRAADTAAIACAHLGLEPVIEAALDGGAFDAREREGGLANVLMVGHEPVFSGVVHELTGARVVFKKGGVAAVERDALVILLRPAELRAIAGTG